MIRYLSMPNYRMLHRMWRCFGVAAAVFCACLPTALASVDLQVESVRIQPFRPVSADKITVHAILKNSGSEPVSNFYVSVNLYQSGKLVKQIEDVPVLSELPRSGLGLSVPVEIGSFPEGEYKIEFYVDSRNQIIETSENNNVKSLALRVYATPKSSMNNGNGRWKSYSY